MDQIERIEKGLVKKQISSCRVGDTVRVYSKVREGEKERIQVFEGVVIRKKGSRHRATVTVRKVSYGVGVERIFPVHSPSLDKIEVVREGKTRRAKLYYLRGKKGKAARIGEREFRTEGEEGEASPPKTDREGLEGLPEAAHSEKP